VSPILYLKGETILITIQNLGKQFQNETQISYRDITFETGKSYMLLGASGCGKSTLLNMIAGVLSPTTGTILIDGKDMTAASQKEKDKFRIEKIGYIFQDFKLIDEMTAADNIGILRLEGVDISATDEILKALDIFEKKNAKIRHLSGGQKQRVAIARALVKKPDIILADEPTGNLNFAIGEQVIRELVKVSKGKTLIAVTHDDRLAKYFDEVVDMNEMTSGMHDSEDAREGEKNA
jgi:putative ABC transport system ATP-binding protein